MIAYILKRLRIRRRLKAIRNEQFQTEFYRRRFK